MYFERFGFVTSPVSFLTTFPMYSLLPLGIVRRLGVCWGIRGRYGRYKTCDECHKVESTHVTNYFIGLNMKDTHHEESTRNENDDIDWKLILLLREENIVVVFGVLVSWCERAWPGVR